MKRLVEVIKGAEAILCRFVRQEREMHRSEDVTKISSILFPRARDERFKQFIIL